MTEKIGQNYGDLHTNKFCSEEAEGAVCGLVILLS